MKLIVEVKDWVIGWIMALSRAARDMFRPCVSFIYYKYYMRRRG